MSLQQLITGVLLLNFATTIAVADSNREKWAFTVDGLPEIGGKVITSMGFGEQKRYSAASDTATVQMVVNGPGKPVQLTLRYNDKKVTCQNAGGAVVKISDDRADVSGTLGCLEAGQPPRPENMRSATVEGWLVIK